MAKIPFSDWVLAMCDENSEFARLSFTEQLEMYAKVSDEFEGDSGGNENF